MKRIKFIALMSIMICLMIAIPAGFAAEEADVNATLSIADGADDTLSIADDVSESLLSADDTEDTLDSVSDESVGAEYYFDLDCLSDGNGSEESPYNNFTEDRITDNSVVHLASGEYNLSRDNSYSNISFNGKSAYDTVLNGKGHELDISTQVTFNNITLKNIKINTGSLFTLTAANAVFRQCGDEYSYGGVIYSSDVGTIILYNCSFYDNTAEMGGAIYMNEGDIQIFNTTFENNAAQYGGAIYANDVLIDIYDSQFISNSAGSQGGAIYSKRSPAIYSSYFFNSSALRGGAVFIEEGRFLEIYNSSFEMCSAEFGGALFVMQSYLISNGSAFNKNEAKYYGGAIFSLHAYANMSNCSFSDNLAGREGGAVYSMWDAFSVEKSSFINNTAMLGGALYVDKEFNQSITDNCFKDNAGAIYSMANENSTIGNNTYMSITDTLIETVTPYMFPASSNYTLYVYNSSYTGELPSSYSLRDEGYVTPVKAQGSGGNCWAFAAMSALESCILKAGGQSYDLSEENMKNLMSWYSDYGWHMTPNKGGYDDMAIGYLISWLGPVFEIDDEYDPSGYLSVVLNSILHVQNVVYLTRSDYLDNDNIKKAIMEYGAVATSIAWYSKYLNNRKNYYCYESAADVDKINHAVTIVGWDDNYSKNNFKGNPAGDGAWIIKNSWGTGSGDGGFYYVSYYDVKFAKPNKTDTTYTFILNDTVKFDKNYQYDVPGKTDFFLNSSSTVWYKNIFNSTANEYLAAVSTFFSKETNWTLSINVNGDLKLTQSGFSKEGYYTINLNEFIQLNAGDVFEVIFKIEVNGDAGIPISEKVSLNNMFYASNISFYSYDGINWRDIYDVVWAYSTHTYKSQVACIKAFTVLDLINTTTHLSILNTADGVVLKAEVLNQYNRPVSVGSVTLTIDNKQYVAKVINGIASVNVLLDCGEYNASAIFSAVGHISSSDNITGSVSSVSTNITLKALNEYNPVEIVAEIIDQYGNPLDMGNVTFTVDGKDVTVNVTNGKAKLTHSFKNLGSNSVSVKFNGIYYYAASNATSNVTVKSTIISNDETKTYNSIYSVSLLDSYGNPLKNTKVTLTIKSKNYYVTTDKKGAAKLTITLSTGSYQVKITNPINKETKTQTVKVVKRITENKDVTMYYGAGKYYKVKVLDDNGKIAKGVKVTFKINNKKYVRTTNDKGYASLKISLKPNVYTVTAEYKGFKVFNKVTVKTTIITKDIKVKKGKTIKFTAKLLNKNGKILKNKKVTFKFKGNTYKIKTNKKGIATLKITKKYKVGKYTIKTTYGSLTVKNTIRIVK